MGEPPVEVPVTAIHPIVIWVELWLIVCRTVGGSGATAATILIGSDSRPEPTTFLACTAIS